MCTLMACGSPPPGPDCQNVRYYRPNGPLCPPLCKKCAEPVCYAQLSRLFRSKVFCQNS